MIESRPHITLTTFYFLQLFVAYERALTKGNAGCTKPKSERKTEGGSWQCYNSAFSPCPLICSRLSVASRGDNGEMKLLLSVLRGNLLVQSTHRRLLLLMPAQGGVPLGHWTKAQSAIHQAGGSCSSTHHQISSNDPSLPDDSASNQESKLCLFLTCLVGF